MTFAHAGLGIVLAGIMVTTEWRAESIKRMLPGDHVQVAGYDLQLAAVTDIAGPNYRAERAEIVVTRDGTEITRLYPERRFYPVQNQRTSETAIRTTGLGDLYVVLSDDESGNGHAVRIYHNPLAPWIWGGAMLMVIGGLISLTDRRFRIGAAARRTRQMPPGAAPSPAE
jgi:cytochrome c-type biogenesis protein CcmF